MPGRLKGAVSRKWRDPAAALLARSTPEPNTGCWLWTESVNEAGYGMVYSHRRRRCERASRLSFEVFKGPIPAGLFVCHSCDQRSCINPDHLWLGTARDNARDMSAKRRFGGVAAHPRRGSQHYAAKLDEITVECMRVGIASGAHSQADWVRWTKLAPCTVSEIVRGFTWRRVTNRFERRAA